MTGDHRRPRTRTLPRPNPRRLAATAGALGATTLAVPLTHGIAFADTPGPDLPHHPDPTSSHHGSHKSRGDRVVDAASDEWGHPYVYGGSGPVVFDCSGLTKYVYNKVGVKLPHNSAAQYKVVDHVAKSDMRRGDLVFIYDEDGIFHVGIYAGSHKMWAATHTGDMVRKEKIWTENFVVGRP